jgi:hypothetical protein
VKRQTRIWLDASFFPSSERDGTDAVFDFSRIIFLLILRIPEPFMGAALLWSRSKKSQEKSVSVAHGK